MDRKNIINIYFIKTKIYMKTIYDIVRGFALKYQIAIFTASFVFVVCSGIFIYQTVRTINTAYTEYTYREEIKEYDRQKQEVIARETEKIKMLNDKVEALKSQLRTAEHNKLVQVPIHQACIAKQKLGVHEGLSQCEYPDSLVGQVNALESIESDRIYSSEVKATGGISPVPKQLKPNELFYTTAVSDGCHVSQGEEDHFKKQNGGMLATDVACRFGQPKAQRAVVYAPDYLGESLYYKITKVGNDKLLGDYIELSTDGESMKWVIAHLETKHKLGDIVAT